MTASIAGLQKNYTDFEQHYGTHCQQGGLGIYEECVLFVLKLIALVARPLSTLDDAIMSTEKAAQTRRSQSTIPPRA
jgi:hypothetical protein